MVRLSSIFLSLSQLLTIERSGLIGHLKNHFAPLHRFYLILQERDGPITSAEIEIAAGLKVLDPETATEYLQSLQQAATSLADAFRKQNEKVAVRICFNCSLCCADIVLDRMLTGIPRPLNGF